jgi:hypothetical protein
MDRLLKNGTVCVKTISSGKRSRSVIDLAKSQLPVESSGIMKIRKAADHLGLPVSIIKQLRTVAIFETKQRAGSEHSWHKDDVEVFKDRGLRLAPCLMTLVPKAMISLEVAMRTKLRNTAAKTDIVAAVFDGRLPVTGRIGDKLSGLLIDKSLLHDFVHVKRVTLGGNSYSFSEAADRTGINSMAIGSAITNGLLTEIKCSSRRRISVESVEHFNSEYTPLSILANEFDTLAQHLKRFCEQKNIPIILLSRSNVESDQPIIEKTHVLELREIWCSSKQCAETKKNLGPLDRKFLYENMLLSYLNELTISGEKLPRHNGSPNRSVISKECGFSRDVLYDFPSVGKLLNEFDSNEHRQHNSDCLDSVGRLKFYLNNLHLEGKALPSINGTHFNNSAIAKASKIDRKVLSKEEAIVLLNTFQYR